MSEDRVRLAAEAIYRAGFWNARQVPPPEAQALWTELRDALGLDAGTSAGPKPGEEEMREANSLVNGDRQADYGSPRGNYLGISKVWSGILCNILKRDITPAEAALMMAGLKLQREAQKHKRDNVVDAHGYLLVLAHILEEEARERG